jgi:hypothetical protein
VRDITPHSKPICSISLQESSNNCAVSSITFKVDFVFLLDQICRLLRMIASRVRDEVDSSTNAQARNSTSELGHNNTNLKTVAVLPVSRNVPVDAFARKLQAALEGIGASTSYLNQASVSSHLGRHAFTRMGKLKVSMFTFFCPIIF